MAESQQPLEVLADELKRRYEALALTRDYNTTASDFHLRDLEIETASAYMQDGQRVLDVGCGLGYAAIQYASRHCVNVSAIDYAEEMIRGARELLAEKPPRLRGTVEFAMASVCQLPYPNDHFDVVTSSRCLMALLDWKLQQDALREIHRALKSGGVLVLMEGTMDGLERLNNMRAKFGLDPIDPEGRDRLFTKKFRESELLEFCQPLFTTEKIQRFGMYYFLSRIVHPLLVAPDKPRYDARINQVAKEIARVIPDYEGIGHLVVFALRKHC